MRFLDANVFLRCWTGDDQAKAQACYDLFQRLGQGEDEAMTCEAVIAEVVYILSRGFTSNSQIARRVTKNWAARNLFCIACDADKLWPMPNNAVVSDFNCPNCSSKYQLKSKGGPFGLKVANSEYSKKIAAIEQGNVPHYAFLQYLPVAPKLWLVRDVFVIPSHFFSRAVIEQRRALSHTAQRSGWVGSNILLGNLPVDARVAVVTGGQVRDRNEVRQKWRRFEFLASPGARGGWGADVWSCVQRLRAETRSTTFTLQAFYSRFVDELRARYPENNNVDAKIRQQLQVLRDGGVLQFLGAGSYEIVQ